jgi:hypothetical protein
LTNLTADGQSEEGNTSARETGTEARTVEKAINEETHSPLLDCPRHQTTDGQVPPKLFFPPPTFEGATEFGDFIIRTCTMPCGNIGTMAPWIGKGDRGSVPPGIRKNPVQAAKFLQDLAREIETLSSKILLLIRKSHQEPASLDHAETGNEMDTKEDCTAGEDNCDDMGTKEDCTDGERNLYRGNVLSCQG